MGRIQIIGVFVLAMMIYAAPVASRPFALNCQTLELKGMVDEWRQVDRVEIDETGSSITFAIAGTIGTADEKSWTFGKTKDAIAYDQVAFERVDDSLRIVALRLGSPVAIWVDPSSVRLVSLNKFGVEFAKLACSGIR